MAAQETEGSLHVILEEVRGTSQAPGTRSWGARHWPVSEEPPPRCPPWEAKRARPGRRNSAVLYAVMDDDVPDH